MITKNKISGRVVYTSNTKNVVGDGGSSIPSSVQYFNGVAVNKLGVDAAITGPTSWSFKIMMGTASTDVSTDTQLHGCVYMRAGGILVAKYSDDVDACVYTVDGGWSATDELIVVLYTSGTTIQLGIVASGAYSWGTTESLVDPKEIDGFYSGTISLVLPSTGDFLFIDGDRISVDSQSIFIYSEV